MARQQPAGAGQADALRQVLALAVERAGLVLEDVVVTPAGSRRLLRVVLDVPSDAPGSLSLDAVAAASRAVSIALDESDVMGGKPYVLEVTSPGVDRPLTEPRHFARNLRRRVEVTLTDDSCVTGRVARAHDALVLTVDGSTRQIPWDDVRRAVVQVEFAALDDEQGQD